MTKEDSELETAVRDQWQLVLADTGLELPASLWLCRGWSAERNVASATYWKPVMAIEDANGILTPAQLLEAASREHRSHHRVALFVDVDVHPASARVAVLGALLRHELQHALQQERCGNDVLDIDDQFLQRAICLRAGGLPGGMELYNAKPMEQDANAAAAMFLRKHHPEAVDSVLNGSHAQLARSLTPPESTDTLLARTVAALFQYRDVITEDCGDLSVSRRLAVYDKRAGELWRQLEAGGEPAAGAEPAGGAVAP